MYNLQITNQSKKKRQQQFPATFLPPKMALRLSSAANGLDPGHEYDFSDTEDKDDVYRYHEQESDEGKFERSLPSIVQHVQNSEALSINHSLFKLQKFSCSVCCTVF